MTNPFFSVVIPTFNREALITRTIQSVLTQEYKHFEVWVIDDGSTDRTEMIFKSIKDDRLHYKKISNVERGAARNVGIKISKGLYITFLDSDDYLHPHHLRYVHQKLNQQNYPVVFHQGYVVMDDSGRVIQNPFSGKDVGKALFIKGNIMSCMGVFVKREVMLQNLFNEDRVLAGLEDWELWIRLASKFPIFNDPTITSVLVQHNTRSVVQVKRSVLETKCQLFIELISTDSFVKIKYGSLIHRLIANVYSYLSLHLSNNKSEKAAAWRYLIKGMKMDVLQFFKKRTVAIIRNLLFT